VKVREVSLPAIDVALVWLSTSAEKIACLQVSVPMFVTNVE
jgi:hypothetical protein